jgi:hypothetical protein
MFKRGGFALTPPRLVTFAVSFVLVVVALASFYTRLPGVGTFVNAHRFAIVVVGYVILVAGVLLRGL